MKKDDNYLEYIPIKNERIQWRDREDDLIQLIVHRNSLFERIIRKLFFTPDKFKIDLDHIGSFIWKNIDGEKSIYDLGELVKHEFKGDAEPLYERLIQYLNILKNNKFIELI
ncbi:PqqD family protein [Wansuia hejianensis]|uniref:PqqD family protein n=1 Tax=Wansuia hejianensis TaxID=2763667 RepID=UPI0020163F7D|nr:PqqD family protein [Wansuia hejianensis]